MDRVFKLPQEKLDLLQPLWSLKYVIEQDFKLLLIGNLANISDSLSLGIILREPYQETEGRTDFLGSLKEPFG